MAVLLRTIKDGRVKINGRYYEPSDQWLAYDGRLDGQRWGFGTYHDPKFVCLWGSEIAFRDGPDADWDTRADCVDGAFVWQWWNAVDPLTNNDASQPTGRRDG